jgi:type II secretory pathway pseudopilin PulG
MTRSRAFTLTELLIAITVLVAVLLAVSKIFTTTGDVVSLGEANADLLQETNAIDRQLRDDLSRVTPEGVFAIRCVRVPNDINLATSGSLLDATLPPTAYLRADQLVFFANGVESAKTFRQGQGSNQKGQGVVSRLYFGHAYQLGEQGRPVEFQGNVPFGFDLNPSGSPLFPWSVEQRQVLQTHYGFGAQAFTFSILPQPVKMPSIDARSWLLARQAVILVDDDADFDASDTVYMGQIATARSIFLNDQEIGAPVLQLVHGRVDGAATQLNDVRRQILFDANGNPRAWNVTGTGDDQRQRIMDFFGGLVYYPRAERIAPSMHRADQALTNNVIGVGCSSVRIEWTYHDGVGKVSDRFGSVLWNGVSTRGQDTANVTLERQPWFGFPDLPLNAGDSYATRVNQGLVATYEDHESENLGAQTIDFTNVEEFKTIGRLEFYEAVFGFNQDMPLDIDPTSPTYGQPTTALGFTPMPSAIRVTLTLHDSKAAIEAGREVQFIIDLPRRSEANVF